MPGRFSIVGRALTSEIGEIFDKMCVCVCVCVLVKKIMEKRLLSFGNSSGFKVHGEDRVGGWLLKSLGAYDGDFSPSAGSPCTQGSDMRFD